MTKRWLDLSEAEIAEKSAKNRAARIPKLSASAQKISNQEFTEANEHYRKKPATVRQKAPQGRESIILTLPYPPTVNHYWLPNFNHSKRIGPKGVKFRDDVIKQCAGLDGVMGRVMVDVRAYPPDNRKRDLDNIFKALLDSLNHAGMIEDDGLIDVLKIQRGETTKGGQVVVCIVPLL
tara:strand:- start:33 stop:566 length:534 start_codon:yes stop_codon:yes gene_type:complete